MTDSAMSNESEVTEAEVAELIVLAVRLEIAPSEIQPDEALFVDGLCLDSLDGLEIALVLSKRYGIELKVEDAKAHNVFASLRTLTHYINKNRRT